MRQYEVSILEELRGKGFLVVTGEITSQDETAFEGELTAFSQQCDEIWILQQYSFNNKLDLSPRSKSEYGNFHIIFFNARDVDTLFEYEIKIDGISSGTQYANVDHAFTPRGWFQITQGTQVEGWIFDPALYLGREEAFLSHKDERYKLTIGAHLKSDGDGDEYSTAGGVFRFCENIGSLAVEDRTAAASSSAVVLTSSGYVLHCEVIIPRSPNHPEPSDESGVNRDRISRPTVADECAPQTGEPSTTRVEEVSQAGLPGIIAPRGTSQSLVAPAIIAALQDPLIFDVDFYSNTYDVKGSESTIVADFLGNLLRQGSPYFDPEWYSNYNSVSGLVGQHPLYHYLTIGRAEGLKPSPIFDGKQIDISRKDMEKILIDSGLFDPVWYLHAYQDVARAKGDPLQHYISVGHREHRRRPNALFNTDWYVKQSRDVADFGWNPLVHYVILGQYKSISTHPIFDLEWFERVVKTEATFSPPLLRLLECLSARLAGPNEYFDVRFYTESHPESIGYPGGALNHYMEIGWKKNFDPSGHFSVAGYLEANPDVRGSNGEPLQHFVASGRKEGRNPKPATREKSASLERFGEQEYGANGPLFEYDSKAKLPADFSHSVAVHLHLFYTEMAEEFARYFNNIPCPFDLFLSIPEGRGNVEAIRQFFVAALPRCGSVVAASPPNRGRDIAPFLVEFGERLLAYDLVLHLHSKRSPHSPKHADWRRYLLHYVLGNEAVVAQILTIFHLNAKAGLVQPPYHPQIRAQPKWGDNRERVRRLLARLGLMFSDEACPDFPAGSFFWARTAAIKPLLEGRLNIEDFEVEGGQIDGTAAHALERLLGIVPVMQGYTNICRYIDVAHNLTNYFGKTRSFEGFSRDRASDILRYQRAVRNRAGRRGRVAVVISIMGPFDALLLPEHLEDDADYFCVSDTVEDGYGVFRVIKPPYVDADPRRTARYVKTNMVRLFRGYQFAVWVDANVLVRDPISKFIDATIRAGTCIGAIPHPIRGSYSEEADVAVEMKLDDRQIIERQLDAYKDVPGLGNEVLIETNFMVFDRRKDATHRFARLWWNQINTYSRRDQLSINYCLIKSGATWHPLLEEYKSTRDAENFCLFRHGLNEWGPKPNVYSSWYIPYTYEGGLPPLQDHYRWSKTAGTLNLDVVVCVHNALDDVRACLSSLDQALEGRGKVIVVDDLSGEETSLFLEEYASGRDEVTLVRHDERLGYTKAANTGIRSGQNKYVLLLNSDTVVPPGSLDKLVDSLDRDDLLGIVGPLSNAASFQSVPSIGGTKSQTAINSLPTHMSANDMDQYLERRWDGNIIRTPLVHGFCFCVRRSVFENIGLFDEVNFPFGYGEENDFCFRTMDAGYDVGVHPGTYVFHAKSKSYSEDERTSFMANGMAALVKKATKPRIVRSVETMQKQPVLAAARAAVAPLFADEGCLAGRPQRQRRRLFLLPSRRSDGLPAGSAYVRVLLPYRLPCLANDWDVIEVHTSKIPIIKDGDCVLIQRDCATLSSPEISNWISSVRATNARFVYEIDDDLLDAEGLRARGFRGNTDELAERVKYFAGAADCVTVSSSELQSRFSAFNKRVALVPNALDADLWELRNPRDLMNVESLSNKAMRPVRIGYVGTPTHGNDLAMIKPAVERIQARFGEKVSFQVVGGFGPKDDGFGAVFPLPVSNDYPSFVRWLRRSVSWDIALVPLRDDKFNSSKSYLKYLECSALNAAVICSDVYEYNKIVQDDVTGLKVANTTESWYDAIASLVVDDARRRRIATSAFDEVRSKHILENLSPLLMSVLSGFSD